MALWVAKSKLECLICNIFHSRLNSANALNISNFGKNIKHKKMSGSKMSVIITAENMLFMDKFTLVANNLHCRRQWQISPLMETYPGVAVAVLSAALCKARTAVHVVNFGLICPARRRLMARKKVIDGGGKSPKRSNWTRHNQHLFHCPPHDHHHHPWTWWAHLKGAAGHEPAPVPAPRHPDSAGRTTRPTRPCMRILNEII